MPDIALNAGTHPAPHALRTRGPSLITHLYGRVANVSWRSGLTVALALLWELAPRLGLTDATFLPPLSEVLAAGWAMALNGQLWQHTSVSLARSLGGLLLAILFAIPLGLAIGWYQRVSSALSQIIELLRNTAPLALLPVFLLLLGIGEVSKVAIVVYACAWPLLLNTINGVRQVDPLLVKSARTMGVSATQLFLKVILPAAVPTIFVGIRLAAASAMLVLIAAEMVGAKAGLGYLIIYAQYSFLIADMYFGIIAITTIGITLNFALERLESHFTAWKPAADGG
ncbi:ABC transporter permease [Variovorax sp. J22R115]|uniref:ABC transporter permease n=1 Tax=Variovorax sp. J22R115 TaxID=3053509 RepID=UPI002575BEC5|nr:ABC transporter permease [Variovorax sp. J22R115]MDM0047901.1 ABC transporter permease [Variovorax sp. J22R115]